MRTTPPRTELVLPELLQGQWTTALIATFGADLNFFETRLLHQLAQVPLRLLLADDRQLSKTLVEAARTGQSHRLANKAYFAAPVRHSRAAHGKLALLLGPSDGLLVVGSGNLGYEGYAAPGELWHVFAYAEDRPQHLGEFAAARSYIDGLARLELLDPPVVELLKAVWREATWVPSAPEGPTAITSNLDRTILEQLTEAASQPVDELIVHAPFHDADCAAVGRLIETVQPRHVRLLVTDNTSAEPDAIARVLSAAATATIERIHIKAEPTAYIHAKWVHLLHGDSETLLTGSANLSRRALLRSAGTGNTELAVITTGVRGAFSSLYEHLSSEPVHDVSTLPIRYRGSTDAASEEPVHPVVLWSRLDGKVLTLIFNRAVPGTTVLDLKDHAGRALVFRGIEIRGAEVRVVLSAESADGLSEGGKVQVRLNADDSQVSETWPYHLAYLWGRLNSASQREHLPRLGDLPEQDADLYALLEELDKSLIIDRISAWRIVKPKESIPQDPHDGGPTIALEDLDWARVRRDPRYGGYFAHGRSIDLPPTDIQVILAAIAGRLGDLGVAVAAPTSEEGDSLAYEGDTSSSESEEDDEFEDELTRRHLPVSTRTRMAFDRFVRRYADALTDSAFIDELGPVPAATNAAVFNYLLVKLLERKAVSPRWAVDAQVRTWTFLWGDTEIPGVASGLDEEAAGVVRQVLVDARARATTIRGLAQSLGYTTEEGLASLRHASRFLITDPEFGLDADLTIESAGGVYPAQGLLDILAQLAAPGTAGELLDFVVAPLGLTRSSATWRNEKVNRPGRISYRSKTFVITAPVDSLTPQLAEAALGRVAVAAHYAGHDDSYARIRFKGNGASVAFWDEDAGRGVVMIGDERHMRDAIRRPWPAWALRLRELRAELRMRAVA